MGMAQKRPKRAITIIQVRDDEGSDDNGDSRGSKKWSHAGGILKVNSTRFSIRVVMGQRQRLGAMMTRHLVRLLMRKMGLLSTKVRGGSCQREFKATSISSLVLDGMHLDM